MEKPLKQKFKQFLPYYAIFGNVYYMYLYTFVS